MTGFGFRGLFTQNYEEGNGKQLEDRSGIGGYMGIGVGSAVYFRRTPPPCNSDYKGY